MLVLSRKLDQDIVIGDNITIRILKIKGNTIRLGIDAPRDVKVVRGELSEQRQGNTIELEAVEDEHADAQVTVVFANDGQSRLPGVAEDGVIPFRQGNRDSQNAPTHSSISYRTKLPPSYQHNRLKELVKELTRGK